MKKKLLPLLLLAGISAYAQTGNVGINTNAPQATLDVTGKPTDTSHFDGIIPPRLTGDQLRAKTYTAGHTGAVVYVTVADTAPAVQTVNVTAPGFYFFDGTRWVAITTGVSNFYNLYTADGTLSGNRTVTQGSNTLAFTSAVNNGFSVDGTTFSVDAANNRVGIGLTTPLFPFQVQNTSFGMSIDRHTNTPGNQSLVTIRKNLSNDPAVIVPLTSGSLIGSLSFSGSTGGTGGFGPYVPPGNATRIGARAEENFTATTAGSSLSLYTTPIGFLQAEERLTVAENGNVGIGKSLINPNSTLQVAGSVSANIRDFSGSILDSDFTVLATGDVTLPTPSISNRGRIYNIIDDNSSGTVTINGSFRRSGSISSSYIVDASSPDNGSVTVQSDGNQWVILSKF